MGIPAPNKKTKVVIKSRSTVNLTAKQLKTFMNKNGFAVRELSELLGVTEQAVKLWLNDLRTINLTNSRLIRLFEKRPLLIKEF